MLAGMFIFIIMGIVGGTPEVRSVVMPISLLCFLAGLGSFLYSKWVEQGTIKDGATAVKRVLDEEINPKYADHPHRLRYTVGSGCAETRSPFGGVPPALCSSAVAAAGCHRWTSPTITAGVASLLSPVCRLACTCAS